MPLSPEAPAWAAEIALAYESTSQGQFILSGNVHDRIPLKGKLINLVGYIETELLAGFQIVFSFDLGNGLRVTRGADLLEGWSGAKRLDGTIRQPLMAVELISAYLRYLANLQTLRQDKPLHVAAINNHPEIVRRLMLVGADPTIRSLSSLTAADVAQSRQVLRAIRQSERHARSFSGGSLHSRTSSATSLRSLWEPMTRAHTSNTHALQLDMRHRPNTRRYKSCRCASVDKWGHSR